MDPQEQQFPQVPPSPSSVPGIPNPVGEQGLSQDQMTSNLKDLMDRINNKYQDFNANEFSAQTKSAQSKSQSLSEVFDLLQSVGIDPSNVEQVKEFLDKIKANNPELYQQVEQALASIIDGNIEEEETSIDTGEIPQDLQNMNINTNDPTQKDI